MLDVSVGTDGRVTEVELISGHPMLMPAAKDAVKSWHFRPYLENGVPTKFRTAVTVTFGPS